MFEDAFYFSANDGTNGYELWRGDASGAPRVVDLFPGLGSSSPGFLTAWNGALYFSAETAPGQRSLFHSDGTASGTVPIAPVTISSQPVELGGALFFGGGAGNVATDGVIGDEPWILDVGTIGAAVADGYGSGCPASGGTVPTLTAIGAPTLGNAAFVLAMASAPVLQPAATAFSTQRAATPFPGAPACQLLVGGSIVLLSGTTDSSGSFVAPLPIPNVAALKGAELFSQAVALDPLLGAVPLVFAAGVQLVVGS